MLETHLEILPKSAIVFFSSVFQNIHNSMGTSIGRNFSGWFLLAGVTFILVLQISFHNSVSVFFLKKKKKQKKKLFT